VQYYEDCQLNLGLEFGEEAYATIRRICEYPDGEYAAAIAPSRKRFHAPCAGTRNSTSQCAGRKQACASQTGWSAPHWTKRR